MIIRHTADPTKTNAKAPIKLYPKLVVESLLGMERNLRV